MAHSEARKPGPHDAPLSLIQLTGERLHALPVQNHGLSRVQGLGEELVAVRVYRLGEEVAKKLKDRSAKKAWQSSYGDFTRALAYLNTQHTQSESDKTYFFSEEQPDNAEIYFQRIGAMFLAVDAVDSLKENILLRGAKQELEDLGIVVRRGLLPLLSVRDHGVGFEDLRSPDRFFKKATLGAFFSIISNVEVDEDGALLVGGKPLTFFISSMLHGSEELLEKRHQKGPEDRKALSALVSSFQTVQKLQEMTFEAVADPNHPDHQEITQKVRDFLTVNKDTTARIHAAAAVLGVDLIKGYRNAYMLRQGESGDIFKNFAAAFIETQSRPESFLYIEEALALCAEGVDEGTPLKGILDVRESIGKIFKGSLNEQVKIGKEKIPGWQGFKVPDGIQFSFDRKHPERVFLEFSYDALGETQTLGVSIDTKTASIDWSVMEPVEAFPDFAKQLLHLSAVVCEAMADAVLGKAAGVVLREPAYQQNGNSEKPNNKFNPRKRRPHNLAITTQPEEPKTQEHGNGHKGIQRRLFFERGSADDLMKNLSSSDRQIVSSAIGRFNSDGLGVFKKVMGVKDGDGNQVWELKTRRQSRGDGIRVLVSEIEDGVPGQQRFKVIKVEHRDHLQYGQLWHTRK